jgi:hypothetical protein
MDELTLSFHRAADIRSDSKDPRRRLERRDFHMINEDHSAIANLPRKAQHHEMPPDHKGIYVLWE